MRESPLFVCRCIFIKEIQYVWSLMRSWACLTNIMVEFGQLLLVGLALLRFTWVRRLNQKTLRSSEKAQSMAFSERPFVIAFNFSLGLVYILLFLLPVSYYFHFHRQYPTYAENPFYKTSRAYFRKRLFGFPFVPQQVHVAPLSESNFPLSSDIIQQLTGQNPIVQRVVLPLDNRLHWATLTIPLLETFRVFIVLRSSHQIRPF